MAADRSVSGAGPKQGEPQAGEPQACGALVTKSNKGLGPTAGLGHSAS